MWQGNGCIMYEIFFVNFLVIILRPIFIHENLKNTKQTKNLKNQKSFLNNLGFASPGSYILAGC